MTITDTDSDWVPDSGGEGDSDDNGSDDNGSEDEVPPRTGSEIRKIDERAPASFPASMPTKKEPADDTESSDES